MVLQFMHTVAGTRSPLLVLPEPGPELDLPGDALLTDPFSLRVELPAASPAARSEGELPAVPDGVVR